MFTKHTSATENPKMFQTYLLLLDTGEPTYVWTIGEYNENGWDIYSDWEDTWEDFLVVEWYDLPTRYAPKIDDTKMTMEAFWEEFLEEECKRNE